jgi:hypothetical protein
MFKLRNLNLHISNLSSWEKKFLRSMEASPEKKSVAGAAAGRRRSLAVEEEEQK